MRQQREDFSHIQVPDGAKLIPLTRGKYALVDEEDYENVNQHSWHAYYSRHSDSHYAAARIKRTLISLHRFLFSQVGNKVEIDHKDHNTLDNRKCNLREVTHEQNSWNSKPKRGSSSKYKGVKWKKHASKWVANIVYRKKDYHLGYFVDEVEAAKAYDKKAEELFGEYAYLNFR